MENPRTGFPYISDLYARSFTYPITRQSENYIHAELTLAIVVFFVSHLERMVVPFLEAPPSLRVNQNAYIKWKTRAQ